MTKEELIEKLKELKQRNEREAEGTHIEADELLLKFINDPDVSKAFEDLERWYA